MGDTKDKHTADDPNLFTHVSHITIGIKPLRMAPDEGDYDPPKPSDAAAKHLFQSIKNLRAVLSGETEDHVNTHKQLSTTANFEQKIYDDFRAGREVKVTVDAVRTDKSHMHLGEFDVTPANVTQFADALDRTTHYVNAYKKYVFDKGQPITAFNLQSIIDSEFAYEMKNILAPASAHASVTTDKRTPEERAQKAAYSMLHSNDSLGTPPLLPDASKVFHRPKARHHGPSHP